DLRDHRADLVVHQRDAALVRRGRVGLERALRGLERGHSASSFGVSRPRVCRMSANLALARSSPSSNRGGLASGCDHSGCRVRTASRHCATQLLSQPSMMDLLCPANSLSLVSSSNMATV